MVYFDKREISSIVSVLKKGNVVAAPTDTIYGLIAIYNNEEAIATIYNIKKRNFDKPLAVLVSDYQQAKQLGDVNDKLIKHLEDNFVTGQVSFIVKKNDALDQFLYWQKLNNIAIRVTNSDFIKSIIKEVGPLVATSVNISGKPSINDYQKLNLQNLGYVVIEKNFKPGKPSTIYDSINEKILRS